MKKVVSLSICVLLLLSIFSFCFSADEEIENDSIELRIEGISGLLFRDDLRGFLGDKDSITVAELLTLVDAERDALTITGISDGYITDINGDTAGKFGGWDGWLFSINGVEASAGIGDVTVKNGDQILFYYGDPYGVGMQFPKAEFDGLEKVITFTSTDVTYDADYNPIESVNPVVGMTVSLVSTEDTTQKFDFVTDETGSVDLSTLEDGEYSVNYSKTAENGLPLVLRSDGTFTILLETVEIPNVDTSDNVLYIFVGLLTLSAISLGTIYVFNKKKVY